MTPSGHKLFTQFSSRCHADDGFSGEEFSKFALEVFAYQFEHNPTYQKFCRYNCVSPESVSSWRDIPALPTDAFKLPNHPVRTESGEYFFLSSGTSGETRAKHEFPELETYRHSILAAWRNARLGLSRKLLFLSKPACEAPNSSLVHMMNVLHQEAAKDITDDNAFLINDENEFIPGELDATIKQGDPVLLFGTALAFLNFVEKEGKTRKLPPGSILLETGGYKGSGRSLEKRDFYQILTKHFGVRHGDIWNEYSMTELSSQAYTSGLESPHTTPPWMKVQVIDLETRRTVAPGALGLLVIYDLANIHSCAAIETQDLAIFHNEHQFTLIGRDPEALPRGCSRAIDYLLNS